VICSLAACQKQVSEAIVVGKEHIAAAAASTATPTGSPAGEQARMNEEQTRPMRNGEIVIDQYVMKSEDRGTGRDPRAIQDEQWLVKVRLVNSERTFNVPADRARFERLREGDRVQVRYRVGKYTNTVWSSDIVEK
jgi:Ni/Co efflux regulator RcnB